MSPPRSNASAPGLDRLEFAALAYLFLPLFVFVLGWLVLPAALLLVAAMAWTLCHIGRRLAPSRGARLGIARWLFLALVAGAWAAASGLIGPLRLNSDWQVRLAVLHDLVVGAWPLSYGPTGGGDLMLRFPMAYFLVPALWGKVAGLNAARIALWAWTAGGTALFFALVLQDPRDSAPLRWRRLVGVCALLVLFSGMDVLGWLSQMLVVPEPGQHLEWWAWVFQYSSQTTLMFWVPNHALPAWLLTAIVWRHRHSSLAVADAAALLLACVAWAPLVALGIAPLLLLACLREQPLRIWWRQALQPAVLATVPPALLFAAFVTFDIPATNVAQLPAETPADLLSTLILFALFEWAAMALVLWRARPQSWLFWAAVAELLILPLLHFGPNNDLVMRGGIPGITIVMLATGETLAAGPLRLRFKLPICAMLLIGAVTPLQEFIRAAQPQAAWQDGRGSLAQQNLAGWNYVGVLHDGPLRHVLATPHELAAKP